MPASAAALPISPGDQAVLRRWANAAQVPATLVQRAKILLLAAEGVANSEIAERLGVARPTVIAWRERYAGEGLTEQLADRPRHPDRMSVRVIVGSSVERINEVEFSSACCGKPSKSPGECS